jgi:histidinol-phosphate aminotransferase
MSINRRKFLQQFASTAAGSAVLVNYPRGEGLELAEEGQTAGRAREVRLDRNENAYGPGPRVIEALRSELGEIHRFPAQPEKTLRDALARFHHREPEQILLGAGCNGIMQMAAWGLLSPEKSVVLATPSYGALEEYARARGAQVIAVPLRKNYSHDLERMLAEVNDATGLVYLCNPNNPTGTLTDRSDIDQFLEKLPKSVPLMIDEAYHEYAGGSGAYVSLLDQSAKVRPGNSVIVLRTFSKAYGLAGLRLGYAVLDQEMGKGLGAAQARFEVNRMALAAGAVALGDREHIADCVRRNRDDRQEFVNQVNARMLRVLDSHTNFACLNVMRPAGDIRKHYQDHGMRLGAGIPELPNYVRVSFGKPEEMKEFWKVWDLLGSHPMAM